MQDKAKKIIKRFDKARSERELIEPILQELSDFVLTHKGNFTRKTIPTVETAKVFDVTVGEAAYRLGSTIHGGLTNSASRWFTLQVPGVTQPSQSSLQWLENASSTMLSIFNGSASGFSSNNFEVIMSMVALGTGALLVEYDQYNKSLRFCSVHLSKVSILEDRWGKVDTVFVKDSMTLRQVVQEFGLDAISDQRKREYANDPDNKIDILHCVAPRNDSNKDIYSQFRFISTYLEPDTNHVIEERGMYNMPYVVGRFDRRAGDLYGVSPAWQALPIVRLLNQQRKDYTKGNQLQSQPPMLMSDDAVMPNLDIRPFGKIIGGIDSTTGQPRIMPLKVGAELQNTLQSIEMDRQQIREMFYVDQLYFKDGTPLTATEASQRQEARTQMLSPAIDRIKTEYLNELINISFDLLLRNGIFGQMPQDLVGARQQVEYLSPLAHLNKMQDVLAVQRALAPLAPFAGMSPELFAGVFDPIDFPKLLEYSYKAAGVPASVMKSEEQMMQEQAEKQQQANLQQNMQLAGFASQLNQPVQ